MVSTTHYEATRVGVDVLRGGGNVIVSARRRRPDLRL
jgi:gamma-glutamyltranspeptidase